MESAYEKKEKIPSKTNERTEKEKDPAKYPYGSFVVIAFYSRFVFDEKNKHRFWEK